MKVGSLFAGVGGFDLAAEAAGMTVTFQSENDKHSSQVLDHHWPDLNLGDIHDIRLLPDSGQSGSNDAQGHVTSDQGGIDHRDSVTTGSSDNSGGRDGTRSTPRVDVLCGGFPCQDYSVAGNRSGLAGDRGALWWEFHRLITEGHPDWVVAENVPGLLSSRGGRDFATIIDSLADIGYTVGWRVLDSQFFGVPQRRRRVFIVAVRDLGIGSPAEVLALAQGMSRDPQPSRKARQEITGTLTGGFGTGGADENSAREGHLIVGHQIQAELIGRSEDAGPNGAGVTDIQTDPAYTLNIAGGVQAVAFRKLRSDQYVKDDIAGTVTARDYKDATDLIAFAQNQREEVRDLNDLAGALAANPGMKQQTYVAGYDEFNNDIDETELHHTLRAGTEQSTGVLTNAIVRRLTPLECERLQGFPDGWTDIENNSNSQRYKQMGNAVAVPVVTWIMKRIADQNKG